MRYTPDPLHEHPDEASYALERAQWLEHRLTYGDDGPAAEDILSDEEIAHIKGAKDSIGESSTVNPRSQDDATRAYEAAELPQQDIRNLPRSAPPPGAPPTSGSETRPRNVPGM